MRRTTQSIIVGSALFAAVALPVGAPAAVGPTSEAQIAWAISPPDDSSPYQKGYAKGLSEGYQEGETRAREHCADIPSWPNWPPGAYGVGYADGYMLGWSRGLEDGRAKYCRPA